MELPHKELAGFDFRGAQLVASFFGAMVYAIVMKVKSPIQMLGIISIGLLVSFFLGPLIVESLRNWGFNSVADDGLQNASGFIAGLSGMAICNGVIAVGAKLGSKKESK